MALAQAPEAPEDPLTRDVEALWTRIATLRNVDTLNRPSAVRAPEEARRAVAEIRAATWLDSARLEARGRAWSDLGLGTERSPERWLRAVAEDLGGAAWEPGAGRLLVDPETLTESDYTADGEETAAIALLMATGVRPDEPVLAHLMVHRLQGEDLEGAETTDAFLARHAAREGEATLVATLLLLESIGVEVGEVDLDPTAMLDGRLAPSGASSPLEIRMLDFVHTDGYLWARRRYLAAGWKPWPAALTTGAILSDAATSVPADVAVPAPPTGWEATDVDRLGAWGVYLWIAATTGKDSLALLSSEGWEGGRLERLERAGGPGATRWTTRWVTAERAEQFRYAIERVLVARFPSAVSSGEAPGWRRRAAGDRLAAWERRDRTVTLWIGPPEATAGFVPDPPSEAVESGGDL
ncbi:MAG: hypothetical protein OER88_01350 [Planctomycetota bacterium]|nr:hypothetical protein [Planctomycetota bacterium]